MTTPSTPHPPAQLLDDTQLARSDVAANCVMNRERGLVGVNSYARDLGFDPLRWLLAAATGGTGDPPPRGSPAGGDIRTSRAGPGHAEPGAPRDDRQLWVDLCCGSGRALIEAGTQVDRSPWAGRLTIIGVDLVDAFVTEPRPTGLQLHVASVSTWAPPRAVNLVTCVHGLHYVGDKLGLLLRAASWLTDGGRLVAHLDPATLRHPDGRSAARRAVAALRRSGFDYDSRRHLVSRGGTTGVRLPATPATPDWAYLGADDQGGPSYRPGRRSLLLPVRLTPTARQT
jgi:SAM-dependent methyltransferase